MEEVWPFIICGVKEERDLALDSKVDLELDTKVEATKADTSLEILFLFSFSLGFLELLDLEDLDF